MNNTKKELSQNEQVELVNILKVRFEKNMNRHMDMEWDKIQTKLEINTEKLWSLNEMEKTGGEPDVVGYDSKNDTYTFCDCSIESPKNRRSFCYDQEALDWRKENKPSNSVITMARNIGIELLSEEEYRELQKTGSYDTKTSSWLKTPPEIRKLGGAIFGDFRYNNVFIYHNWAESYYAARGFRGLLKI